ncbi:MAG: VOC family protein [Acidimicrobiales bacterium]|nr:VOC family protein [Acidimicrobiales bacterium]
MGLRVAPDRADQAIRFYPDILGLVADPARRNDPTFPGAWLDCSNDTQVHLMGVEGVSRFARSEDMDPATRHIALGVPDLDAAKQELDRLDVGWWSVAQGPTDQVFFTDPSGNMIELHQSDQCRCRSSLRKQ